MHGHGDGANVHYSISLWPRDSSFTISSLYCVLFALERPPIHESQDMFPILPQKDFFELLLDGKSKCSSPILTTTIDPTLIPHAMRPMVLFPKKLYLQLDNLTKNNKNRFVMALYSLLTTRHTFKEVTLSFLIVDRIHKDLNAHFTYMFKLIKMKNTYVLVNFMKVFMNFQKILAFIPKFV